MKPTEAQIKEFWEWCGCSKLTVFEPNTQMFMGLNPKGQISVLSIDLNNLFKYAVSKMWVFNVSLEEGIFWSVKASCPDVHGRGKHGTGKALEEDLSLAIFWAIWGVIHED